MPPIGETLREARLRQKIDIAEVEQATKIRAKYLRALEGEEFDRLPGATFVRTFLRTYADYLGLDSQLLVEEYRARHESPADEELQPFAPQPSSPAVGAEPRRRPLAGPGAPGRGTMIAGAVVAILAILLVIGLLGGDEEGGEREGSPGAAGGDGGRGGEERAGAGDVERTADEVKLQVTPLTATYVCIENAAGEQLVNATIAEPQSFRADSLRLNLGNTLAIELEANGEEVPIEESPNPVGLELTPEGQRDIPEGERPCQ